jgi:hypothetical protein
MHKFQSFNFNRKDWFPLSTDFFPLSVRRVFLVEVEDQFPPYMMKMNEFPYRATVNKVHFSLL